MPHQRFSKEEYMLMSTQLDLPEWLGVPLRQIPPEYEYNAANFNRSAGPKSLRWYNNYRAVRQRPGLRFLSAEDFWIQEEQDFERLPKCRKYLAERRRRPALAVMRAHLETLVALADGGVASAEVTAEVNAEAVQVNRNAPPALHSTATDQEEVAVVGERTFAQRDAECRNNETQRDADLNNETPRKRDRAAAGALEERVVGARSVCTAAVDKRARELALPAFDEYMADRIDAAELDKRKAEAYAKATAEHA